MGTPDFEHFQSLIYFKPLPKSNIFSLDTIFWFTLKHVFYNSERHNSQLYIKLKAVVSNIPFPILQATTISLNRQELASFNSLLFTVERKIYIPLQVEHLSIYCFGTPAWLERERVSNVLEHHFIEETLHTVPYITGCSNRKKCHVMSSPPPFFEK